MKYGNTYDDAPSRTYYDDRFGSPLTGWGFIGLAALSGAIVAVVDVVYDTMTRRGTAVVYAP